MSFVEEIKAERERLGITQAQAAYLLSVSKSVLAKWETVDRTPIAITQKRGKPAGEMYPARELLCVDGCSPKSVERRGHARRGGLPK